ncbi:MAG: sulfurtransferase TusE [Candidatus Parabeggiatoa sp. nov. 3]|jgi:tRNA 2-thiouridine synthesizing protein E|nr:MAG: sulfurtransferase TusE [Gammaproteobacteria bacterium]RKZ68929.1 MAG: sulfurtransferase TusE [Gammaproteobacteria bacterium]RKZ83142.1 MAG: sulfurtransferase TusE [Gammaproteobacteria bacterium]
MQLEINGKSIETDSQGYLVNLSDWNEELANLLAEQDDLPLSEAHWEIIHKIRTYYQDHSTAPAMRALIKLVKEDLGSDKGNSKYLYSLFPYGPGKQAARYGGLPKPTGCV